MNLLNKQSTSSLYTHNNNNFTPGLFTGIGVTLLAIYALPLIFSLTLGLLFTLVPIIVLGVVGYIAWNLFKRPKY